MKHSSGEILIMAAALLSEDNENIEYDRAIAELTRDILGLDMDQADMLALLRVVR